MGRQKKRTMKKYNRPRRKNNTRRKTQKKRVRKTHKKRTRKIIRGGAGFDFLNERQDDTNASGSITDDPNNLYQLISGDGGIPLAGNPVTQSAPAPAQAAVAPAQAAPAAQQAPAPTQAAAAQQAAAEQQAAAAQQAVAQQQGQQQGQDEEKRIDPRDGGQYTRQEFIEFYGDENIWNYVGEQQELKNQVNQLLEAAKTTDLNNNPQLQQQINNLEKKLEKKNKILGATTGLAATAGLIGAIGLPATAAAAGTVAAGVATGAAAKKTLNVALSSFEKGKRADSMRNCNRCMPDMVEYHVVTKDDGEQLLHRYKENRPKVKITHSSSNLKNQKENIKNAKDNPPNAPLQINQTA
jgi:hypothetical protein